MAALPASARRAQAAQPPELRRWLAPAALAEAVRASARLLAAASATAAPPATGCSAVMQRHRPADAPATHPCTHTCDRPLRQPASRCRAKRSACVHRCGVMRVAAAEERRQARATQRDRDVRVFKKRAQHCTRAGQQRAALRTDARKRTRQLLLAAGQDVHLLLRARVDQLLQLRGLRATGVRRDTGGFVAVPRGVRWTTAA